MSVSASFSSLLDRIQPTQVEIQRAVEHSKQIKTRLEQSNNLRKLFYAGSFPRQTYIHNSSDIDFLAVFSRDDLRAGFADLDFDVLLAIWLSVVRATASSAATDTSPPKASPRAEG